MGELLRHLDPNNTQDRLQYRGILQEHVNEILFTSQEIRGVIEEGGKRFFEVCRRSVDLRASHLYRHIVDDGFFPNISEIEGRVLIMYLGQKGPRKASEVGIRMGGISPIKIGIIRRRALQKLKAVRFDEWNMYI